MAVPAGQGALLLEVSLNPQEEVAVVRRRAVTLLVNGKVIGARVLGGPLCWRVAVAPGRRRRLNIALRWGQAEARGVQLTSLALLYDVHAALPRAVRDCAAYVFGWNEETAGLLVAGWGTPEDHYVWAIGGASELVVPVPADGQKRLALLDMRPFLHPTAPPAQRVLISAGGAAPMALLLRDRLTVAVDVQGAAGERAVRLLFRNLDADYKTTDPLHHFGKPFAWALARLRVVPALPRFLPAARPPVPGRMEDGSLRAQVMARTGMTVEALVAAFESLGNGCELGLVQQRLGLDRVGLLRFSGTRQRELVEGLFRGFHGVARPERLQWIVRRPEDDTWRLIEDEYGLNTATPHSRFADPPAQGIREGARRMSFLAARLMEDIAAAERIFVLRMSEPGGDAVIPAAALSVQAALRHYGEAEMIWLTTDGARPPGSAERLACGLVRGYLESPLTGRAISDEAMISALANCLILLRQAAPLPPGA